VTNTDPPDSIYYFNYAVYFSVNITLGLPKNNQFTPYNLFNEI